MDRGKEELYDICIKKREGKVNLSWDDINKQYGYPCANGESLRQWIKKQLKVAGKLPTKQQVISNETQKKLSHVKELIGEQEILKTQIRQEKNKLSKIQRDFIKSITIAEDLKDYFIDNCVVTIPEQLHTPVKGKSRYEMLVHITDWHIGYVIDNCKGNYFNWDIANERVNKLIGECYKYIELYDIKKIYVVNTGDIIEHTYMRDNQSQFCEFNQSEQINKAIEIIYRFLCALCEKNCNVEYDSIYGNHDRSNGEKKANLDGDNAEVIIREQLGVYKILSKNNRLTVVNREHNAKEIRKTINGIKCKFIHGEESTKDGKKAIKNEMSMDNEFYDVLFKGHLHNFNIESENHGRYIVYTGCLSGYNDYSVRFGSTTDASQTIGIFDNGKIELIKDVNLFKYIK